MFLGRLARLFTIRTRLEAFLIIYALALGATSRGSQYLADYPGAAGKVLFLACTVAVFLAGGKILDCLRYERSAPQARAIAPTPAAAPGKSQEGRV